MIVERGLEGLPLISLGPGLILQVLMYPGAWVRKGQTDIIEKQKTDEVLFLSFFVCSFVSLSDSTYKSISVCSIFKIPHINLFLSGQELWNPGRQPFKRKK